MITQSMLAEAGAELTARAAIKIPEDYLSGLKRVAAREEGDLSSFVLQAMLDNYEAAEVMQCLRSGATESQVMPLDESIEILRTMDKIRAQWGLKYPTER